MVPLSTSPPVPVQPYHYRFMFREDLPPPYDNPIQWAKCDMIYTVGHHRLSLPFNGKDEHGKRILIQQVIDADDLEAIQHGIRAALGL